MRIAEVIGTVTFSRIHPSIQGYRWVIGVPYSFKGLVNNKSDGEDIVMLDELNAGIGQKAGVSEGVEAQMPFYPIKKPIDAYCACILDAISINKEII